MPLRVDVLLFLFGTSLLFHVQFQPLLPDLHTGSQGAGHVVWYSHLFQNFPQFISAKLKVIPRGLSDGFDSIFSMPYIVQEASSSVEWSAPVFYLVIR